MNIYDSITLQLVKSIRLKSETLNQYIYVNKILSADRTNLNINFAQFIEKSMEIEISFHIGAMTTHGCNH